MINPANNNLSFYPYTANTVTNGQSPFSQAFLQQLASYNLPARYQSTLRSLTTPSATVKEVADLWTSMNSLNNAAKPLIAAGAASAFAQKVVISGAGAAVKGTATTKAANAGYDIAVSQLAAAQQNSGTALDAAGGVLASGLAGPAVAKFSITPAGGTAQKFTVAVNPGDTDKAVLDKMAKAINSGSTVVKAAVTTTTAAGVSSSRLVLTGANTGAGAAFTVADITGNLASASGIGSVSAAARDASYTINGAAATSTSNTIKIDDGNVTLTLAATTTGVRIDVGADTAGVTQQVTAFVNQYNATLRTLQSSGLTSGAQYAKQLGQNLPRNASELSGIGVTINPDKTISFDQSAFQDALSRDYNKTKSLIGNYGGLIAGVQKIARNVSSQPPASLAGLETGFAGMTAAYRQQYWQSALFDWLSGGVGGSINIVA